jgi:hypothetical protein
MQVSEGSALIETRAGTQKINLPLTLASNTTLSTFAGAALIIADPMTIRPGVTVTQTGGGTVSYLSTVNVVAGARIAFGGDATVGALSLAVGSSAQAADVGRSFVNVNRFSVATGATFELGGSVLAIQDASPEAVRAMIAAGQITSRDVADAEDAATILVFDASALAAGGETSIDPRFFSFTTGSVAVPAYLGDVDLDGTVTPRDLQVVIDHLGARSSSDIGWLKGDVNRDGLVDGIDQQITFANIGMTVVPEPTTLVGLLAACPLGFRRRVAKRREIVGVRHVTPFDAR